MTGDGHVSWIHAVLAVVESEIHAKTEQLVACPLFMSGAANCPEPPPESVAVALRARFVLHAFAPQPVEALHTAPASAQFSDAPEVQVPEPLQVLAAV